MDASSGDILSHLPRPDVEPGRPQFVVQLGVDQVDLTKVRLGRIDSHPRAVLDCPSEVRVALDAEACNQPDGIDCRLAEGVHRAATDGHHLTHWSIPSSNELTAASSPSATLALPA